MATINLGAIKFNWKGAYNSSTTYAVDDVVSSGGNSYVCIQAHSNQAVGNATAYWNIMSSAGTNGTDGTDLTSTLTTQGDIVYRDGSGLARLGYGTAGQVLQTGGSGANPSWTNQAEGGLIHLLTQTASNVASVDFVHGTNGVVFDSTYRHYVIMVSDIVLATDNIVFGVRFKQGGSFRSSNYDYASSTYEQSSGNNDSANTGQNYGRLIPRNLGNQSNENFGCRIDIPNPSGSRQKTAYVLGGGRGGNGTVGWQVGATINTTDNAVMTGIQVIGASGNITSGYFSLYGMKSS